MRQAGDLHARDEADARSDCPVRHATGEQPERQQHEAFKAEPYVARVQVVALEKVPGQLRGQQTSDEGQERGQVRRRSRDVPAGERDAHEHDVPALRVGEYLAMGQVDPSIHRSAGHSRERARREDG